MGTTIPQEQGPARRGGSGSAHIWVVVKMMVRFLGYLNIRWCRIIIGTQKGTITLTTTHTSLGCASKGSVGKASLQNGDTGFVVTAFLKGFVSLPPANAS